MTSIILPMAGAGRRFAEAGYELPKPFIDVHGRHMIERVLENLYFSGSRFILIAQQEHVQRFANVFARLHQQYPVHVVTVPGLTEGAACTVLTAARMINNDASIVIANSDQILDVKVEEFVADSDARGLDGSILTFWANDPKWSFAEIDSAGLVKRVAEKQVISQHATAGLYYFRHGKDFLHAAVDMIVRNERVNNEFYVAPAYNYAIHAGSKIGIYEMNVAAMHGLGTPADLQRYLAQGVVVA